MKLSNLKITTPFELETGETLPEVVISYCTSGNLNKQRDNVVWVFHALTGNPDPTDWWSGLFGEGKLFNPQEYFIICANVLGGCYGTTGPCADETPLNLKGLNFPKITVRDVVKAHELLADHLGISEVEYAIGGSFGGYQALEFSLSRINVINLIVIASAVNESPWNIAIHEAQRMAILSDATLTYSRGGKKGLETARGIGLLTYRTPKAYCLTQPRKENQTQDFAAASYIRYQGEKLSKRFSAHSYLTLINCLDTHDLARARGTLKNALGQIKAKTLCIGIKEDLLASPQLLKTAANQIPNGHFEQISSKFGHDGFLLETEQISTIIHKHFN